jgi:hypothetical protein
MYNCTETVCTRIRLQLDYAKSEIDKDWTKPHLNWSVYYVWKTKQKTKTKTKPTTTEHRKFIAEACTIKCTIPVHKPKIKYTIVNQGVYVAGNWMTERRYAILTFAISITKSNAHKKMFCILQQHRFRVFITTEKLTCGKCLTCDSDWTEKKRKQLP